MISRPLNKTKRKLDESYEKDLRLSLLLNMNTKLSKIATIFNMSEHELINWIKIKRKFRFEDMKGTLYFGSKDSPYYETELDMIHSLNGHNYTYSSLSPSEKEIWNTTENEYKSWVIEREIRSEF